MTVNKGERLILGISGASGSYAAQLLIEKSIWPIDVIVSKWGKRVMEHEYFDEKFLIKGNNSKFQNDDLFAPISSGSVSTFGMVVLPCSSKTLGEIANGISSTLITRAAHCHLKEKRPLILCVRETPLSGIDIENMMKVNNAGAIVMPISPPFFMFKKKNPTDISMKDLLGCFIDRILSLLGKNDITTWKDIR